MKKLTNDHRTRVTKMLIRNALMELLQQKPIQSISIKELCERADINRGTFYTHYTDIYDLLSQLEDDMFEELKNTLYQLLNMNKEEISPVKLTAEIFQCLKDNYDLCVVTLGNFGDKSFLSRLINFGREICLESYSKYFENASTLKIDYFYTFVSAGCIGLLRKWLNDGKNIPAEDIARMAEKIMLRGISFLE